MLHMLKTYKILPVFAFLAFILISMPVQEAFAVEAVVVTRHTGDTAGNSAATTTIDIVFDQRVFVDTVAADGTAVDKQALFDVAGAGAGVGITNAFVTDVDAAAPNDATCATATASATVVITLDVALATDATPTVQFTNDASVLTCDTLDTAAANFGPTAATDGLSPTMDSAAVTGAATIDVTFSEDLDNAGSVVAGDFTLDQSLTVAGIAEAAGVVTITTNQAIPDGATPTVTLADDVDDVALNTLAAGPTVLASTTTVSQAGQGSGCRSDCQAPTLGVNSEGDRFVTNGFTYNGKSTDVERFYTPYPLITANVGVPNQAVFKIYDNYGSQNVKHVSLAFGLGDNQIISQSKAMIELDIDFTGIETVTITDPENALDNVKVRTSTGNCNASSEMECLIVTIDHTFRAPLDFNMVSTEVWDNRLNSWQNYYNHGIEVVGESLNPPNEYFGIYKGELIHIIETGKNTAVDADDNTWTFDNIWIKDYIYKGKIEDPISSQGYDRNHVKFNAIMQEQELVASALMEKYYKTSFSQEPAFKEINDIYPTYVTQGFDRDHPDFAAYQQEQVQKALSFLKQHFPKYSSESFEEIDDIYFYEYLEQNKPDSETMKYNINQAVKKAQQTIQEFYKSSYQ